MYYSPIINYSPILVLDNKEKIQLLSKELFLEIERENIRLKEDPMSFKNYGFMQLLFIGIPLVILVLCVASILIYTMKGKIPIADGIIGSIMTSLFIMIPVSELYKIYLKINHYKYLISINDYLIDGSNITDTIPAILRKVEKIGKIYKFDLYEKNHSQIKDLELEYINLVLNDLRSDLAIRLTEQQQSLESTKSEVEQNIKGTTELSQVSEVQRARLDRQIEQFEELQRVLIKA